MRNLITRLKKLTETVYGAIIALIVFSASLVAVVTFILQAPTLWKDFRKDNISTTVEGETLQCKEVFSNSSNYKILVLPFFKTCETGRDVGLEIRNRLELLKYNDSLSIDVCYLDSFKQDPNFTKEKADKVRKKYNASQIIYGMNGSLNCTPQDTLMEVCVNYVSDKENTSVRPISIKQVKASLSDIRQGFLQADIDFIVYYFSAVSDVEKGKYKQSLKKLSKISNSNSYAKYYSLRGYLNEQLGQYDSALVNYNKALKLDASFDNLYRRGSAYRLYFNKAELSAIDFKKAISMTKDSLQLSDVFFSLGAAFYEMSEYDSSIKYINLNLKYSKLEDYNRSNFAAMYAIKGYDLLSLSRTYDANSNFDKALKFDRNYNLAIEGKAESLAKSGEFSKSISLYNKLIKSSPKTYRYYLERGSLFELMDSTDKSQKDYITGLKIDNQSSLVYQYIGRKRRDNNYLWGSLKILNIAADKYPNDPDIYFELGLTCSELSVLARSASYYSKVLKINPKHNPARFNRGVIYVQTGRYKEAIIDFNEYIRTKGFDPPAYYWRGIAKINISDESGLEDIKRGASGGLVQAKQFKDMSLDDI